MVLITPTGGLEYWEHFDHAVRANAQSLGMRTEMAAPQSVTDYTEQAQMVENAISRHVQGIIVSPAHQLVLTSVLQKAVRANISVVVVGNADRAASQKHFAAFIGVERSRKRADWRPGDLSRYSEAKEKWASSASAPPSKKAR